MTKPDPFAIAEQAVRSAKEHHAALLNKLAKLDVEILTHAEIYRSQSARPSEMADSARRLRNIERVLAMLRADERVLRRATRTAGSPA
jgi:hypothetical protein